MIYSLTILNKQESLMAEYFKNVSKIELAVMESNVPLTFHHYNPEKLVVGKSMNEHL